MLMNPRLRASGETAGLEADIKAHAADHTLVCVETMRLELEKRGGGPGYRDLKQLDAMIALWSATARSLDEEATRDSSRPL